MIKLLLTCCLITGSLPLHAQSSPVKWVFGARKKNAGMYDVCLTATVPAPWHIYSQNTPAGGPFPTEIFLSPNPLVNVTGAAVEDGKSTTTHDQNFGVDVIYFQGRVSFIQHIKLKTPVKTSLHGTVEYMVCNDNKCLPPVTIPFDVTLN
jgi:thiol:disulfide interchange protein DsbD